jgi:type IV secretion system protein VirB11
MKAPPGSIYLQSALEPLAPYLAREDVTDIYITRPGEVWIEALGKKPERKAAVELTEALLSRLARQVAAASSQGISRSHPLLAANLPTGERVQIVMPPATRSGIIVAIRKHVVAGLTLDDYAHAGAFKDTQLSTADDQDERGKKAEIETDIAALLRSAVRLRRTILISGGTASGKTTFLNTLLGEIPKDERLVFIEDTPELKLQHDNAVGLVAARGDLAEAEVSAEDLLIASLRLRPDRIILGELRGREAATFLRATNTGHPGSLTTIHADSPLRALDQLALLVLQSGTRMAWDDVLRYIRQSVDIVVQLSRLDGRREIAAIDILSENLFT